MLVRILDLIVSSAQVEDQVIHVAQQHDELRDRVGVSDEPGAASRARRASPRRVLLPHVQQDALRQVRGVASNFAQKPELLSILVCAITLVLKVPTRTTLLNQSDLH